jgi:hypothetical protein
LVFKEVGWNWAEGACPFTGKKCRAGKKIEREDKLGKKNGQ